MRQNFAGILRVDFLPVGSTQVSRTAPENAKNVPRNIISRRGGNDFFSGKLGGSRTFHAGRFSNFLDFG